jgi:hypothetical protein
LRELHDEGERAARDRGICDLEPGGHAINQDCRVPKSFEKARRASVDEADPDSVARPRRGRVLAARHRPSPAPLCDRSGSRSPCCATSISLAAIARWAGPPYSQA